MRGIVRQWLGLALLLVMVEGVYCCEMIQFPSFEENGDHNPHNNNNNKMMGIGSRGMPMMRDSWYQIRPCKQGITIGETGNNHCGDERTQRCVRLESYHYPDHFLRQTPQRNMRLHPFPYAQRDHHTFHLDSSFCMTTAYIEEPDHPPLPSTDGSSSISKSTPFGTRGGTFRRKRISLESVKHPGLYLSSAVTSSSPQDQLQEGDGRSSSSSSASASAGFGKGGGDLRLSGGLKLVLIEDHTTPLWQQDQQLDALTITFPCKGYYGMRQSEKEAAEDAVHHQSY